MIHKLLRAPGRAQCGSAARVVRDVAVGPVGYSCPMHTTSAIMIRSSVGPRGNDPILPLHITQGILRDMQAKAPPLLPLLRSRLQAEILTLVMLSPGREWSLTELAQRVGASVATAQREVARAEQTGVLSSRRLGSARLVTAANSPLTGPLTDLLLRSFGPRQVLAEELDGLAGINQAFLFGSWAARYAGQPGRAPADIDILIIGSPDRNDLDDAVQRASDRMAREVNATIRSPTTRARSRPRAAGPGHRTG
jgi:predicted nucleotidyltransferase